jgi:hypothetical protein
MQSYLQSERDLVTPLRFIIDQCIQDQSTQELTDDPAQVDVRCERKGVS